MILWLGFAVPTGAMLLNKWTRAFFDHLLVSPLNRALPLTEMYGISKTITEDLDFNMMAVRLPWRQ